MATDDGITRIDHAGRQLKLRAPASQSLNLTGTGPETAVWEPTNREASDIEVRARIASASGVIGTIPVVRYKIELGHGNTAYSEPAEPLPIISGTPQNEWSLPARGFSWRITAREFRITFRNQGMLTGAPLEKTTIQVSVLPSWGSFWPINPYQHLALPFAAVQNRFPITAREWRVYDVAGLPFGAAVATVTFAGINGGLFGVNDAALYGDWQPIPHDAATWIASAPMYASFR